MAKLDIVYDEMKHYTAVRLKNNNKFSIDCPCTGKCVEFSPSDALGASFAGCMLISIGAFAMRHNIDLQNTHI